MSTKKISISENMYRVELNNPTEQDMQDFAKAMDEYHEAMNAYIQEEADELGISFGAMADIHYLRTRSRWTQEAENYLIDLAKSGKPFPNMCEWPPGPRKEIEAAIRRTESFYGVEEE